MGEKFSLLGPHIDRQSLPGPVCLDVREEPFRIFMEVQKRRGPSVEDAALALT
jgi:hypothetical protein